MLKVTTIQSIIHWEDTQANLDLFSKKMEGLEGQTDLVILPEMFTTGFSMNPTGIAESMEGSTVAWMKKKAEQLQAVVTGSLIVEDQGRYYNRLVWMFPDGTCQTYDKRHLFTLAGEDKNYDRGRKKLIVSWKGWKICPLICYDLRFPVWARNTENYDLLIFTANWPKARTNAWRTLLEARAIENQCYVVGVNRVGKDHNDLAYLGYSSVIDYTGVVLHQVAEIEQVFTTALSQDKMMLFRKKLNFLADRDDFRIVD